MTEEITLQGHKVAKGKAEGEALVTTKAISFFGGVNTATGEVTDKNHELNGANMAGKILIFPDEKGSTAGAYQLYEMEYNHTAPKGIINLQAGANIAVGAIISNIPMMDRVAPDPFETIKTGDWVALDADRGIIKVRKKK